MWRTSMLPGERASRKERTCSSLRGEGKEFRGESTTARLYMSLSRIPTAGFSARAVHWNRWRTSAKIRWRASTALSADQHIVENAIQHVFKTSTGNATECQKWRNGWLRLNPQHYRSYRTAEPLATLRCHVPRSKLNGRPRAARKASTNVEVSSGVAAKGPGAPLL